MFYSTTTENRLVAEDFQQWINTIISKHTDMKRHKKDINKTDLELKQEFVTGLQSIEKVKLVSSLVTVSIHLIGRGIISTSVTP